MFGFLQFLSVFVFFVALIMYFGKILKKPLPLVLGLCTWLFIAALISAVILNVIPMPTEQITLTATGERNELALNNEIALSGILVDGKTFEVENAVEGKWFWQGDKYMWRNENDLRQPAGTTRSITLNIPVGDGRALVFNNNQYRGLVEITYQGMSQKFDLYSELTEDVKIAIPSTDRFYDDIVKIGRLALFVAIIILLMAYPFWAIKRYDFQVIKRFFEKHWDKFIYAMIACACFVVMFETNKNGSLWYDEIWNLGWYYTEIPGKTSIVYHTIYNFWFKLIPYGQQYLMMISEIFVALSIYFVGLAGSIYDGKKLGILVASLMASSPVVLSQCGGEFRSYALWLFSVSACLYFFIKKQKELNNPQISTLVLYSSALVLCMDSHTMGLITAGFMILFDILIILKEKIKNKAKLFIELIFPCIYGLYYIIFQFFYDVSFAQNYSWPPKPTIKAVVEFIIYLSGNTNITFILLILGVCVILFKIIYKVLTYKFDYISDYIQMVCLFVPMLLFAFVVIYSTWINSNNSIFVSRYLISCSVFFVFIMSIGIKWLIDALSDSIHKNERIVICMSIGIVFCLLNWYGLSADYRNNYRGSADFLMAQNDIYSPKTLCMVAGNSNINSGFEYYLSHNGKRDSINHCSFSDSAFLDYDTVYVIYHHSSFDVNIFLQNGYVEENSNDNLAMKKYIRNN